jgi:hypothetical protein
MSVLVSLVVAATAREREAAIASRIANEFAADIATDIATSSATSPLIRHAVLLEGLPDGQGQLDTLLAHHAIPVIRIAAGCLCCIGNTVLRVNINRLLRHRPERLFIGIATPDHLEQLRALLQNPPYTTWLHLEPDIRQQTADSLSASKLHPADK